MEKKKIQAVIEIAKDGGYGVYCVSEPFTGMGKTVEAAKKDMLDGMELLKRTCQEDGSEYPAILNEDFEIEYKFHGILFRYNNSCCPWSHIRN